MLGDLSHFSREKARRDTMIDIDKGSFSDQHFKTELQSSISLALREKEKRRENIETLTSFIFENNQFFAKKMKLDKLNVLKDIFIENNPRGSFADLVKKLGREDSHEFDQLRVEGLLRNPLICKKLAEKIILNLENQIHRNLPANGQVLESRRLAHEAATRFEFSSEFFNAISEYFAQKDQLSGMEKRENILEYQNFMEKMGKKAIVAFLDFDYFKQVNDQFGHHAGDEIVRTFSQICQEKFREIFRESDLAARWGGDEFLMFFFFDQDISQEDLEKLKNKIQEAIEKIGSEFLQKTSYIETESKSPIKISEVMGISCGIFQQGEEKIEISIKNADDLMYLAKGKKRPGEIHVIRP